jgi:endonuclease/exonuclease/phosphatase family metal-dependent hydrolase
VPFYYDLHHLGAYGQRTAGGLLRLKDGFKEDGVPERVRSSKLLLATWNIREFESAKYGPREKEALYYIAEIIDHFDIVAVQEVREDLSSLERVMGILGSLVGLSPDRRARAVSRETSSGWRSSYDTRKDSVSVASPAKSSSRRRPTQGPGEPIRADALHRRLPSPGGSNSPSARRTAFYGAGFARRSPAPARDSAARRTLADEADQASAWAHNMILLGDFNIFDVNDATSESADGRRLPGPPEAARHPAPTSTSRSTSIRSRSSRRT